METNDNRWYFDVTKFSVVDKAWIQDKVTYDSIPGFVADVTRGCTDWVDEWNEVYKDCKPDTRYMVNKYAEWWLGV